MILFLADNHFEQNSGKSLYDVIQNDYSINFFEDNFSSVNTDHFEKAELLILNLIEGTSGNGLIADNVAENIKTYLISRKPLLLLHGASAALWSRDWWRPMVGLRWVRPNDPDGSEPSTHPVEPFELEKSKTFHSLVNQLKKVQVSKDEIYIKLEQRSPILSLMETNWEGKTYCQAYLAASPFGGKIASYIPGHKKEVVQHPDMIHNVKVLIDHLLNK